jgi:hypothetical protein
MFDFLFKRKREEVKKEEVKKDVEESHNEKLVNIFIELLETKPEAFNSRWYSCSPDTLQESVIYMPNGRRIKQDIHIMAYGEVLSPIRGCQTKEQQKRLEQLIKPIIERDSKAILDKYESLKGK